MTDKDTQTDAEKEAAAKAADDKKALEDDAEKWKAMSRKHEAEAKKNKAELDTLKAAKDTEKSDAERLEARMAAAETRAANAETESRRYQVAASKGLTPGQAKRLQGESIEELESDADELLESFKPNPDKGDGKDGKDGKDGTDKGADDKAEKTSGGRPKEKLRAGTDTEVDADDEKDPREIVKNIPRDRF